MAVGVVLGVRAGGAWHPRIVQCPGNAGDAATVAALIEDPLHVFGGARIGVEALHAPSPAGMRPVGVRPGVHQSVAVRWATAEIPALIAGFGAHRRRGPKPRAQDFPTCLGSQL
jgi:hypothetical protein